LKRHANPESGKFLNKHGKSKGKGALSESRTVATPTEFESKYAPPRIG